MGRTTFVAWLYVMAAACVVIAIGDRAWGWLIGGGIFFGVAHVARRLLRAEAVQGRAGPRFSFVTVALLVMLVVMFLLFWLQTRA